MQLVEFDIMGELALKRKLQHKPTVTTLFVCCLAKAQAAWKIAALLGVYSAGYVRMDASGVPESGECLDIFLD
jgi:hypothetical protein